MWVTKQLLDPTDFHSMETKHYESQWGPETVWLPTFRRKFKCDWQKPRVLLCVCVCLTDKSSALFLWNSWRNFRTVAVTWATLSRGRSKQSMSRLHTWAKTIYSDSLQKYVNFRLITIHTNVIIAYCNLPSGFFHRKVILYCIFTTRGQSLLRYYNSDTDAQYSFVWSSLILNSSCNWILYQH